MKARRHSSGTSGSGDIDGSDRGYLEQHPLMTSDVSRRRSSYDLPAMWKCDVDAEIRLEIWWYRGMEFTDRDCDDSEYGDL
jgi:hypothetical protein